MNERRRSRLWLFLIAVAVTLCLPMTVFADGTGDSSSTTKEEGGMVLNKSVRLEDDATYTITMEGYATGEVQTVESVVPTDIVLVLDVSGSMRDGLSTEYTYTARSSRGYSYNDYEDRRYYYRDGDEYYRVYRVREGGSNGNRYRRLYYEKDGTRYYLSGTGVTTTPPTNVTNSNTTIWTGVLYNRGTTTVTKIEALRTAANAFIDTINARNQGITDPDQRHKLSVVKLAGTKNETVGNDTYYSGYNQYNYSQIVSSLTTVTNTSANSMKQTINSITPRGATSSDYAMELAQTALGPKQEGREQVVVLFMDGSPTHNNGFEEDVANDTITASKALKDSGATVFTIGVFSGANVNDVTGDANKFMNAVSSNYPNAASMTNIGSRVSADREYYKVAENAEQLSSIFEAISQDVANTNVTLDAQSAMIDIVTPEFTITVDSNSNPSVNAQVFDYLGRDGSNNRTWSDTPNQTLTDQLVYNQLTTGDRVSVTGFDYTANYVLDGQGTIPTKGAKIVVTITGIIPAETAFDAGAFNAGDSDYVRDVTTNDARSGIYAAGSDEPAYSFDQPSMQLATKAYVLDYAKESRLGELTGAQVPNTMMDVPARWDESTQYEVQGDNGIATYHADDSTLWYRPYNMDWGGIDSFYGFHMSQQFLNWTRYSVIPASSVFYEDDFITNTETGTVGIVYSEGDWTTDGEKDGNEGEVVSDDVQGWIHQMSDDPTYSNGQAHATAKARATATFTFTGTGFDIYSRTDINTGSIIVRVNKVDGDTPVRVANYIMDTQSLSSGENGAYYQIPTASVQDLEYGQYTVKITVANNGDLASKKYTYYLDGIRIYHPLGDQEESDVVRHAYGEKEENPVYAEVRDMILSAAEAEGQTELNGAVFIDKDPETGTTSIQDMIDYGPKNEVYLAPGQSVAFRVSTDSGYYYYVGLKSPTGEHATAQYSYGNGVVNTDTLQRTITNTSGVQETISVPISAADNYYEVKPNAQGYIVISNAGNSLLSITKIRQTGYEQDSFTSSFSLMSMNVDEMFAYLESFDNLEEILYDSESEEVFEDTEEEIVEDTEILPEEDIVIENSDADSEAEDNSTEESDEASRQSSFQSLFDRIRNWFSKRR